MPGRMPRCLRRLYLRHSRTAIRGDPIGASSTPGEFGVNWKTMPSGQLAASDESSLDSRSKHTGSICGAAVHSSANRSSTHSSAPLALAEGDDADSPRFGTGLWYSSRALQHSFPGPWSVVHWGVDLAK